VSTNEGDYSRWLGPDWKPSFTGASTLVCNHVSWLDYFVATYLFQPSYLAKKTTSANPFLGAFSQALDCLFLDPSKAFDQIKERQIEISHEKGIPPLMIFPEGSTSNNQYLLKFRKGPFLAMRSVQPIAIKYRSSNGISVYNDSLKRISYFLPFFALFTRVSVKVYPVFEPNQYFIDKFCKDDDEEWKAFLKVVREKIMARSFDFKLSEATAESKVKFCNILREKYEGVDQDMLTANLKLY
jgi:lysophosphatidylcholine acyltransferase/lyso-PAF acetyltransferase